MNQELMEYIKNHIKEYLPLEYQDASIVLEEVTKNNDRVLTGRLCEGMVKQPHPQSIRNSMPNRLTTDVL